MRFALAECKSLMLRFFSGRRERQKMQRRLFGVMIANLRLSTTSAAVASPSFPPPTRTLNMPKIEERIETLKARLKELEAHKGKVEARKRFLLARRARKDDTRRKILAGATVLTKVDAGELDPKTFRKWLDQVLTRNDERALFDLPPRSPSATK